MKEEKNILQDVIGTSQPEEETKVKKYVRIAFSVIMLGLLAIVVVMAAIRKFGS